MSPQPNAPDLSQVRVLAIVSWGRSGTLFLGSLLDGHHQVLSLSDLCITGFFSRIWPVLRKRLDQTPAPDGAVLASLFMQQLSWGPPQGVATDLFENQLARALDQLPHVTARHFFITLHLIYESLLGRDLSKKTTINYQFHGTSDLTEAAALLQVFPDAVFLGIYRDPLPSMASVLRSYLDHAGRRAHHPEMALYETVYLRGQFDLWYRFMLLGWMPLVTWFHVPVVEVRLESLHAAPEKTLGEMADQLGLAWDPKLLESTFGGQPMVQASYSERGSHSGFRKMTVKPRDREVFNRLDAFVLRGLLRDFVEQHGYGPVSRLHQAFALLLGWLPMHLELQAFFHAVRRGDRILVKAAADTWARRVLSLVRIIRGKMVTIGDLNGHDLRYPNVVDDGAKMPFIKKARARVLKLKRRFPDAVIALAPANDLALEVARLFKAANLAQPPFLDRSPQKPWHGPLRSYHDLDGIDYVVVCSPNYWREISRDLADGGLKKHQIIVPG